ncbi:hypothetical protein J1605_013182 [Eschrichtius robustus]|uniref:ABC transporter domain-containing protein n=1 Tax=Eschrichtius robustus TaxID=9764 RepID=A0AB34GI33_ESCRO|nr:hypothetical protein J1605_013182 [Eschrichtius robustus]
MRSPGEVVPGSPDPGSGGLHRLPGGYLAPRNLPSTGFFPLLQTLLCDTDSKCKDTPYGPQDLLRRKGIDDAQFKDSEILRKSSNLEKDSNLSVQSTEVPEKRHASLATVFPSPSSDLESNGTDTFNGSQVLAWILSLEKLSSDPNNQKTVFQEMVKVLSFFSQVQEQTAVWQLLSSFPNVFQNDTTLSNLFDVLRSANRLLILENFEDALLNISVDSPYIPYLACVRNVTDNLATGSKENLRLLHSTIRFKKSFLQNGSYEDYFPPVPEVLKSKLSQLRNLTKLLCEPETFSSLEKMCQLSSMDFGNLCEESAFHVQLLKAAEFSTEIATSLLYHDNILSEKLRDLLSGDPSKINLDMDRFLEQALQMNYLENITRLMPTIEAVLHVNDSAGTLEKPGQLIEMFKNVEELKEELRRTTGMSNRSIDNLLAIPIPDNRAESNVTLRQLAELKEKSQEWVDKSPFFMNSFHLLNQMIPVLQNTLRNPFVQVFVKFSVGLDAIELLKQMDELDILRLKLENGIDLIDHLNTLSSLTVNVSSCILYDRIQAAKSIDEMEREAKGLYKSNELFGSVIFKLPSNSSQHRSYDSENVSLPPVVKYTIRMSLKTSQTTRSIRTKIWAPGPHNSPSNNQIYGRAFVYLQDSIERAIIELQTGRNSQEIAVQVQAIPYPCYMKDKQFQTFSRTPSRLAVAQQPPSGCVHTANPSPLPGIRPLKPKPQLPAPVCPGGFSVLAMSYLISVFFNNTNIAALIGSLIYIIAFFPFIVLVTIENELSYIVKVFMNLLSPTAFSYASQYIARYEEQGIGTYGMAAPWYFPFLPSYWKERLGCAEVKHEKSNGLMFTNIMMQNTRPSASKTSPEYMFPSNTESEPKDLTVGVALHGVTKNYGSKIAVANLSLNFYEGHITSLLGPNGAGKTTTISLLTGLFDASAGTIFVYGKDIKTDLHTVRKNLGVCMQHDVLFSYLTTKEHLLLYGSIKAPHWTKKELHEEVKRTIILSTHHLDEAEVLSDRIAFLEEGGLRCCGSPFYLKEAFGDGYHLTLTKKKSPNVNASTVCDTTAVTAVIQSHLPEAYLKEDIGGELVYVLPLFSTEVSGAYLSLLRALDNGLSDLNIGCYGISDTTMEEVFLNLTKGSQKNNDMSLEHLTQKKIGNSSTSGISTPDDLSVSSSNFTDRDDKILTRRERLGGFGLLLKKVMAILIQRFHHTRRNWKGFIAQVILPIIFVTTAMGLGTLRSSSNSYPEIQISPSLYGTSEQTAFYAYGGWSFGLPLTEDLRFDITTVPANRTLAKVWYDPEGYHSLPAYLNSLNNFLLRVNMSKYDAARHVALSILLGYSVTTASFVTYVVREHQTKAKQLQHISGIGVTCYWVTNFIYDMAFYLVPVAFSIGVIAIFKLPAFYSENNLSAVSLLLLLFGYATFSWMYLLAGLFHETGVAFITYVCINLFFGINSIVSLSVVYFLSKEKPNDMTLELISETLKRIFLIFPQFCFGYGLIELSQQQSVLDFLKAYGVEYPSETFEMDKLGAMFVALVSQGTMFFFLRLLINEWLMNKLRLFFKKFHSSPVIETIVEDEDVWAERFRVENGVNEYDLVQLHRLTKTYHLIHKKIIAVNNISIGIPAGECFGLLGVNGAGKTTIFKMLTGDIIPTSGNILIRNKIGSLTHVDSHSSLIGYCPQEDALDDLVTVEEHLYFYARIHGIPEKDIKEDEPSSGMDPKSKRHLWKIISEEVQNKCSVILTSHSMEECEALCTRLAIMVNGRFQCIGSLQHIKSRFGRGFTVKVHVKNARDQHLSMLEYHVPVTAGGVANIFDLLETNKTALNITNFLVSQTTLEEVFINFAKDQKCYETADTSSQGSTVSTDSQDDQL